MSMLLGKKDLIISPIQEQQKLAEAKLQKKAILPKLDEAAASVDDVRQSPPIHIFAATHICYRPRSDVRWLIVAHGSDDNVPLRVQFLISPSRPTLQDFIG